MVIKLNIFHMHRMRDKKKKLTIEVELNSTVLAAKTKIWKKYPSNINYFLAPPMFQKFIYHGKILSDEQSILDLIHEQNSLCAQKAINSDKNETPMNINLTLLQFPRTNSHLKQILDVISDDSPTIDPAIICRQHKISMARVMKIIDFLEASGYLKIEIQPNNRAMETEEKTESDTEIEIEDNNSPNYNSRLSAHITVDQFESMLERILESDVLRSDDPQMSLLTRSQSMIQLPSAANNNTRSIERFADTEPDENMDENSAEETAVAMDIDIDPSEDEMDDEMEDEMNQNLEILLRRMCDLREQSMQLREQQEQELQNLQDLHESHVQRMRENSYASVHSTDSNDDSNRRSSGSLILQRTSIVRLIMNDLSQQLLSSLSALTDSESDEVEDKENEEYQSDDNSSENETYTNDNK